MRQIILTLLTLTALTSCVVTRGYKRIGEIVLINTSGEKCEVGHLIDLVDKCNPKVIGLNLLFSTNNNLICDNNLIKAIEQSGKIILIEGLYDSLSDESFYIKAKYTGETGIAHDSDSCAHCYYRISQHSNGRFSFPYFIALHYDKSKGPLLASQSFPKPYPLKFYHQLADFKVLTIDDIAKDSNQLTNKIVLIGRLAESQTNTQANIILDILSDLDNKNIKINKYTDYVRQQQMSKD
ncbi:MAG: CHASE2 domain-containing protein [Cytophagales bacterium]|nr:CHASE2 domain-containing protein [Cytophagales bacterium]MCA6376608.1 CHASE2 domain-containing protein [Cytophagales bacterium]MCA6384046.1 CHASE2 domain-containing protein [Cytophagales bacterium]